MIKYSYYKYIYDIIDFVKLYIFDMDPSSQN